MKHLYMFFAFMVVATVSAQDKHSDSHIVPSFPGGKEVFYAYIRENIQEPEVDKDVFLRAVVSFIVEKDGTLSNVCVVEEPGYGFGQELARVIAACPEKWNPGLMNGKPVRARYNLPVTFKAKVPKKKKNKNKGEQEQLSEENPLDKN